MTGPGQWPGGGCQILKSNHINPMRAEPYIFAMPPLRSIRGLMVALMLATAPAVAQDTTIPADPAIEDGVVNAAMLRPVPKDASISVRAWDNSADNMRLVTEIEEQLRMRGHTVTPNGALVLSFSASDQPGRWGTGARRQLFDLHGRASTAEDEEAQVRLNLYSSERGGVFNQVPAVPTVRSTYTLEMTIDRRDGQRLWQGEASAKLGRTDGPQLVKLMIPPLLDAIGKMVRSQPFGVK